MNRLILTSLSIVCLVVLPVLFESCTSCGGWFGGNDGPYIYDVEGMELYILDNHGRSVTSVTEPVPMKYFQAEFTVTKHVPHVSYIQSTMGAYACSPAESFAQQIVSLSIVSDREFKSTIKTYAAGEELGEFVRVSTGDGTSRFATAVKGEKIDFKIFMKFETSIAAQQEHDFTFRLKLDNGKEFRSSTGNVVLLP